MNAKEWLAKVSNQSEEAFELAPIASAARISQSTLYRREKANDLTADQVIAISRAYAYDVIEALLELGFIAEEELRRPRALASIRDLSDEDIVSEVARRVGLYGPGRRTAFDEEIEGS